jgi:hypothetical protein
VLGGDLHVEKQRAGRDEAVEPAAGRGLGAAERGGEIGDGEAAVAAELGQQELVLGVEGDGCGEGGGGGRWPPVRAIFLVCAVVRALVRPFQPVAPPKKVRSTLRASTCTIWRLRGRVPSSRASRWPRDPMLAWQVISAPAEVSMTQEMSSRRARARAIGRALSGTQRSRRNQSVRPRRRLSGRPTTRSTP